MRSLIRPLAVAAAASPRSRSLWPRRRLAVGRQPIAEYSGIGQSVFGRIAQRRRVAQRLADDLLRDEAKSSSVRSSSGSRPRPGSTLQVNYAGTTDLAATILEEGDASPADVFFAQDAGALGAVGAEGRLAHAPGRRRWLGSMSASAPTTGLDRRVGSSPRRRSTTSRTVTPRPTSRRRSTRFTDPAWKGRIGWAPTNASLQSFVTAYRLLKGDDAAKAWLEGIEANEPKVYDGNDAVLAAVAAGEVEVGFVNHYYLMQQLEEQGESFPVRNHFLAGGDPGALVNVAGAGILSTAKNPAAAQAFVDFLLTQESQTYFATETHEYPLIDGRGRRIRLCRPLAEIQSPDIDLSDLADLRGHPQAPAGRRRPLGTGDPAALSRPPPTVGSVRRLPAVVRAYEDADATGAVAARGCGGLVIAVLALLPLVYLVIRALGAEEHAVAFLAPAADRSRSSPATLALAAPGRDRHDRASASRWRG